MSDYRLIGYDFETLKTDILNKIKTKSEYPDVSEEDPVLQMFLYILTYKESFLMGTINKSFIDYFPNISSADEAVYAFADYIKMPITGITSAEGTLKFSLSSTHTKDVIIPANTEVSNVDGSIIYSTKPYAEIIAGETELEVEAIQGQWKSISYVSDGENYQRYYIYEDIDVEQTILTVDSVEWIKVDNFYFSTDTDNHYMIKFIHNGYMIVFSEGVFGAKPQSGDDIEIDYLKSLGDDGNIYTANTITTIISNIYDNDSDIVDNISVTNEDAILGGQNQDTIDEIKRNINRFFISNPYITRRIDYQEYLKSHPDVVDCNIYAGWEVYPNNPEYWTTVYIYVVPKNILYLTEDQKEDLFDYIKEKDIFNTKIIFVDCSYVKNYLGITIKFKETRLSQAKINDVKNQITTIVTDYYDIEKAVLDEDDGGYGTVFRNIYHSEIVERIMDITDLRKINLYIQTVETISEISENDTSFSKSLEYKDLKSEETYLYLNDELVGAFDASWDLVPNDNSGSGGINWVGKISSSINYTEKSILITILDPTLTSSSNPDNIIDDIFYIRCNSLNDDDIIADESGNQVFLYYNSNIDIES